MVFLLDVFVYALMLHSMENVTVTGRDSVSTEIVRSPEQELLNRVVFKSLNFVNVEWKSSYYGCHYF